MDLLALLRGTGSPSSSRRKDSRSRGSSTSRALASMSGSRRSQQWATLWGSVWASARMLCTLPVATVASLGCPAASASFPGMGPGQVVRPGPGGSGPGLRAPGTRGPPRGRGRRRRPRATCRLRAPSDRARPTPPSRCLATHRRTLSDVRPPFPATGPGVSPESLASGIRALAAAWACDARMRASRPVLSLSFAPSTTIVFDPANPCLPPLPPVNGSMPRLQSNYFVDIVVAGRNVGIPVAAVQPPALSPT